jgi:plastocyanin
MNRRLTVALAATAAFGVCALGTVSTAAAAPKALKGKIRIVGGPVYKPGVMVGDNVRFNRHTTVKSGGTVKIVDKGSPMAGPHTVSLLKKTALPRTMAQAEPCFEGQGVCAPLFAAHQVPENPEEPPGVIEYNAGAAGFDTMGDANTAGDSLFMPPQAGGSIKVTAPKGSKLTYFCAVHPWMQGKITVN